MEVAMPRWNSGLATVAALFLAASPAFGQSLPCVDPFDVRSPSGNYVLHVEPSEPRGWDAAGYTLRRTGEVLWTKELDCTLEDAVAGDDGAFAGAAQRRLESLDFELVLLLVGPDGARRYEACLPPEPGIMHGSDYPLCAGILRVPERDSAVFRVVHHQQGFDTTEEWRVIDWTTGKEITTSIPADQLAETFAVGRFVSAHV